MIDRSFGSLTDGTVVVRRFQESDIPTLVQYRSDPSVAKWQGWGDGFTEAQGLSLLEALQQDHPGKDGEWFQFAVESAGTFVGDIGTFFEGHQRATIGYTIDPRVQRKGLATRAVGLVIDYLRDVHRIEVISAGTLPNNEASIALLERLGFAQVGEINNEGEATFELDLRAS